MTDSELNKLLKDNGQEHVLHFWNELTPEKKGVLAGQLQTIDFNWLEKRCDNVKNNIEEFKLPVAVTPAPVITLPQNAADIKSRTQMQNLGSTAISEGKLGIFLVAGGQGSRLGFDGPKGCYPVGPNSGKTLFQWHAEQIKAAGKKYNTTIPWYIMTSTLNHNDTINFFAENDYFGLGQENVLCFKQRMVPSVDNDYKLILSEKNQLALNPDGHGGCFWAICNSGALEDMQKRGIEYLSYFQVDNPLVTIADPVFLGYHLNAQSEMSSKILKKATPDEKVGNICIGDGKPTVIEYSDMTEENTLARDSEGNLLFWAGSIAIHIINVDFVEKIGSNARLPWHVAKKKIPYIDREGTKIQPETNNGIKFETFVFDAIPLVNQTLTLEVAREEEFAPVKNATGIDSAESCRQLMSNRFANWLESCGYTVPRKDNGDSAFSLEISPLFALDQEEFIKKCPENVEVKDGMIID